jgi:hypothetical protein
MNTFDQENNGILDNQSYSNFEWLHNQDFIQEDLLSPKQEPTWIQNHQNQSLNPETEQSSTRGHFELQDQSYFNQPPSHDTLFRPNLLVHTQDQLVHQQNNAILPNFTSMEAENLFTTLNSESIHHKYWEMQSQSTIDQNHQSHQVIDQNHQSHQGIVAIHPEPGPSIPRKVTRKSEADIVTTRIIHASNANTKLIKTMVSRPSQTFRVPPRVSKATQTPQPTEDDAAGINSPRIQKLYSTLKRLDRKASSIVTTSDNALRIVQSKQSILQSLNIQMAHLNKLEAVSIFKLYQRKPFPNVLPQRMDSTMSQAISYTASEFFIFRRMN